MNPSIKNANVVKLFSSLSLILATALWSIAFVYTKTIINIFPTCLYLTVRFGVAAIILLIILNKKVMDITRAELLQGIKMGIFLFLEFLTYTLAIKYVVLATRASFLLSSYIIFIPIVAFFLMKKIPKIGDFISIALCIIGIFIMIGKDFRDINVYDSFGLLCGLAYAFHTLFSSVGSKKYDGRTLNLIQLSTVAILSLISTIFFIIIPNQLSGQYIEALQHFHELPIINLVCLAIISTIIPYFLMIYGQKNVSALTSGILLSFEIVFQLLFSIISLKEPVNVSLIIGALFIICASFIGEYINGKIDQKKIKS